MSFRRFVTQSFISFMFLLLGSIAVGQVQFTLPLMYHDTTIYRDTIYWGVHSSASYCLTDSGEWELPQACGLIPCVRFVDVRPLGNGACMGQGTFSDIRPSFSASQIDTYKVRFESIFPITFRWLPTLYQYYDSAKIVLTGVSIPEINMFSQDSLFIDDLNVTAIKIFTWGQKSPNGIGEFWDEQPMRISLEQNYPNPFNPFTVIRYQLPVKSSVSLKVFDVLGRNVVTLVDEVQDAGNKSVTWDAVANSNSPLPSGVYYYRLQTETFSNTKKLLIIR